MQPSEFIDPDKFKFTDTTLKYEDISMMPYLH